MIGEINVAQKGGLNMEINGQVKEYTAGENINGGEFVKLSGNNVFKVQNSTDTIKGIAKTSGKTGKTIKVCVSEYA